MKSASSVGIIVPTMNRPDFIVRQINYYARLNSPHTLYYADSSNEKNAKIIKGEVQKFKDKININYQVPNTLSRCAEFLESNSNYNTAMGRSVKILKPWLTL